MLDLHSHILPCVDDGSRSVAESLALLRAEKEQYVDTVCLTPHFYPSESDPEKFFRKRDMTFQVFSDYLPSDVPSLRLGAEFAYYSGISQTEIIYRFRIQGSNLLLIEMPFNPWTDSAVEDILALNARAGIQVVLAHVDRYFPFASAKILRRLSDNGVLFQFNADAIVHPFQRHRVLSLIKKLPCFLLGSDCHNMAHRPPHIGEARAILQKALGELALDRMDAISRNLLSYQTPFEDAVSK